MATNNVFIAQEDLQEDVQCSFCAEAYDVPKVLPCGTSICTTCETKYFKSSVQQACDKCLEYHEIPASGDFPVNDELLEKTTNAPHSELTAETINKIGVMKRKFVNELSNLDLIVIEHCDLMRHQVYNKVDSTIDAIKSYRDKLLSEINVYQEHCLTQCANIEEFKAFVQQSKENYSNWLKLVKRTDINDTDIDDLSTEYAKLITKFELYEKKLENYIFGKQKLQFTENDGEVSTRIIGKLTKTFFAMDISDKLPALQINYNTETQPAESNYHDVNLMQIDEEKVCIAVSISFKGHNYLKLKLFSKDGQMIKETSEKLYTGSCHQFGAALFKDQVVIQMNSGFNSGELRIYNRNLDVIKSRNAWLYTSTLFTDNKLIYAYKRGDNRWYIFDENLNQLEWIYTGNGESYPFIRNSASEVELKYGRIFIYLNMELRVIDNETRAIIKTIQIDERYADKNNFSVKPASSNTFMIIDKSKKAVQIYDFELQCLKEFALTNVDKISSVSLTGEDSIVIYDTTATKAYVF